MVMKQGEILKELAWLGLVFCASTITGAWLLVSE
jgi:hypothetical protein